jgi:hypothetical protein
LVQTAAECIPVDKGFCVVELAVTASGQGVPVEVFSPFQLPVDCLDLEKQYLRWRKDAQLVDTLVQDVEELNVVAAWCLAC